MFDVKDKIVLITGAANGIGASVVRALLDENVKHVTILDIQEQNGRALEEELNTKYGSNKVKFIKCNITQEQDLINVFRTVKIEQGYIDVVINNAGIFNDKTFAKEIEINFTALVSSSIHALNLMREDEGGRGGTIINIASVAAIGFFPVVPVYSGTKTAVVMFSTMIGGELYYSRTGVRVLSICFGVTDTQIISRSNVGSFDPVIEDMIVVALDGLPWQTTEQAAQGLIDAYKNGQSGSVWVVTSGQPAINVTEKYLQTAQAFNDIILN